MSEHNKYPYRASQLMGYYQENELIDSSNFIVLVEDHRTALLYMYPDKKVPEYSCGVFIMAWLLEPDADCSVTHWEMQDIASSWVNAINVDDDLKALLILKQELQEQGKC